MWLFIDENVFGAPALPFVMNVPFGIGQSIGFVFALLVGGLAAAVVSLLVAIPSFRTRGDYLAIVTLALNFIVLAVLNNIDSIGGARGLNGVPLWSNATWVFVMTVLSLFGISNLVTSTFGKGIVAIREDEIAADLMSVNTRQVKLIAFMFSSFLAGVAGGLFGHVLAYVNPGTFGILKSTEVLVMVYLGGMGSLTGSIVAAVIFTILLEALRPLGVLKWVVIPLILILMMIYRPQGLFGNREINLNLGSTRKDPAGPDAPLNGKEAADGLATD
jgi:branched-chain amino acid transport system permease protein